MKNTSRNFLEKLNLTNFQVNIATLYFCTWSYVARISSQQICGDCITGCQHCSFSTTEDILNILTGNVLVHEQDGQPVLRDEEIFSGECLTDGKRKNNLWLEVPNPSMFTATVRVFSDSIFITGPDSLESTSIRNLGN